MNELTPASEPVLDPRPFEVRPPHWHYGRCHWQIHFTWEERVAMSELGIGPDQVRQNEQKRVRFVSLYGRDISDELLANLAAFAELEHVDLRDSAVTNRAFQYLSLPKLRWIWIAGTQTSEIAIRTFEKTHPDVFVFREGQGAIWNPLLSRWVKIEEGWWPIRKPWWKFW